MKYRKKVSKSKSKRMFKKTGSKINRRNTTRSMRGGHRL